MTYDIGIDLGTTYSAIAIAGKVPLSPNYPGGEGTYLEDCNVTIIPSRLGETLIASVLWEEAGRTLVGIEAKDIARQGGSPIMFSKRSIGTTTELRLNQGTLTAKEVARRILRHLKECAEEALGGPVRRAVVTHPAYFDPNQVGETLEAAVGAGFEMEHRQMLMEPVAAAICYLHGDARDPLRVLACDIGGGTYDVTLLERRDGVTTMRTFDGDQLLGGYNFDRAIAYWVIEKVRASGRDIRNLDPEGNPEDRARWAKLLHLAERVKEDLSRATLLKQRVPVHASDILVDRQGRSVMISEAITRGEFEGLIFDHLVEVVACAYRCMAPLATSNPEGFRAMARSMLESRETDPAKGRARLRELGLDLDAGEPLDMLLMVGGSSRGPWIQEALRQAFPDVEARLFEPDLCVAAGAAIAASTLPALVQGDGLRLIPNAPASSPLPRTDVGVQVCREDGGPLDAPARAALSVALTVTGRTLDPLPLDLKGNVLFRDVELATEEATPMEIRVVGPGGRTVLSHSLAISYRPDEVDTSISRTLPKSLYLETIEGRKTIAEEGAELPTHAEVRSRRVHGDSSLSLRVFQFDSPIGVVTIDEIPPEAGDGAPIVLSLDITPSNEITGTARVLNARDRKTVVAECAVHIRFPALVIPSHDELLDRLVQIEQQRAQLLELSQDPEQRTLLAGLGAKLARKVGTALTRKDDRQEILRDLDTLDRLVNPTTDDLDPPYAVFRARLTDTRARLHAREGDPQFGALELRLDNFESEGKDAADTKNHRKWAVVNDGLAQLHRQVTEVTRRDDGPPSELPPTPYLKDQFRSEIEELRATLERKKTECEHDAAYASRYLPRATDYEGQIDSLVAQGAQVNDSLEPQRANAKIQLLERTAKALRKKIANLTIDSE